ncbi:MAG: ABC transporter permease [Desulfovibrio sp.]|nr:MAG: ABC transporter permease [Desulfovibrio sp.]
MAWRNVWRNPRRSLLTMAAIAFAVLLVIFMVSFQFGSYESMIANAVEIGTGHMQIQAEGYYDKPTIRKVIPDPATAMEILDSAPGVVAYASRGSSFALLSSEDRTYGGMVRGIDPEAEARVTSLPDLVREGEYLAPDDYDQALIGELLAKNLGVGIGDELVVLGQGRDGSFAAAVYIIKGIFSSGQDEMDRSVIHVPLANFEDTFFMQGAVHEIVVKADSLGSVDATREALAMGLAQNGADNGLAVLTWEELLPGIKQSIQMDMVGGFFFHLLLIIVVAFSILNTFLMAVFERTREFGVMMAMGATPGRLVRLLLLESGFTTLVGIIAGFISGLALTWYLQKQGIPLPESTVELVKMYGMPERMYPKLSWFSLTIGPVAVSIITMLAALYPALRVRRLTPAQAMAAT